MRTGRPTAATDVATVVTAHALTPESFAPYGHVIAATEDGVAFGAADASLELHRGTPRFYIMRLRDRTPVFDRITRHRAVTQCLASVGGAPWYIAVCPPDAVDEPAATPDVERLMAFAIPGDVAVKLHRGTWHAGPYFDEPVQSFFNLELSDTNQVDHHTVEIGSWRIAAAR